MLNWASEECRQWVIEHGAAVELGISFAGDTGKLAGPPLVFLSPRSGPDADELADLERVLMSMLLAGNYKDLAGQCARGGFAFQWRCKLADLARACTNWPHDVAPRVYASADKALTIEANRRRHVDADKLQLASALIENLRQAYSTGQAGLATHREIAAQLAQWDKLKG